MIMEERRWKGRDMERKYLQKGGLRDGEVL